MVGKSSTEKWWLFLRSIELPTSRSPSPRVSTPGPPQGPQRRSADPPGVAAVNMAVVFPCTRDMQGACGGLRARVHGSERRDGEFPLGPYSPGSAWGLSHARRWVESQLPTGFWETGWPDGDLSLRVESACHPREMRFPGEGSPDSWRLAP